MMSPPPSALIHVQDGRVKCVSVWISIAHERTRIFWFSFDNDVQQLTNYLMVRLNFLI
jgi:hypothetical protein